MEILLWLLPSVVVTCAAMAWVGWVGRDRPERERSEADLQRFAEALRRPVPDERRRRQRERSTGVAQRRAPRPRDPQDRGQTRRSA